jgi:hypothetical protein
VNIKPPETEAEYEHLRKFQKSFQENLDIINSPDFEPPANVDPLILQAQQDAYRSTLKEMTAAIAVWERNH